MVRIPYLLSKISVSLWFEFPQHNIFSLRPTIPVPLLLVNSNAFSKPFTLTMSLEFGTLSYQSSLSLQLIKTFLWQHIYSTFNPHNTCSWFLCCPCHLCLINNSSISFSTLEINYNYSFISHRFHIPVCFLLSQPY